MVVGGGRRRRQSAWDNTLHFRREWLRAKPMASWVSMGSFCRRQGVPELFTGSSDGFDALQVKRFLVSPERVQLGDFRALESVTLADL